MNIGAIIYTYIHTWNDMCIYIYIEGLNGELGSQYRDSSRGMCRDDLGIITIHSCNLPESPVTSVSVHCWSLAGALAKLKETAHGTVDTKNPAWPYYTILL